MFQAKSKQQQGKSKAINPSNPFSSLNPNDFIPKRFGLHYQRPTIKYLVPSTGKLYHHKMRLEQKLKNNLSINEILNHLRERHAEYLNDIRDEQLIKLITTLKNDNQKGQKGMTMTMTSTQKPAPLQSANQNQQQSKISKLEPLIKLEPLAKLQPLGIKKQEIKKNTYEDDFDDILNDLGFPDNKPNSKISYEKKNQTANSFFTKKEDKEEKDLNKLTTEELLVEKKKMDGMFFQNQKKPGDNGFKYDIQEEFEPYEENEWDMDDEEDDII